MAVIPLILTSTTTQNYVAVNTSSELWGWDVDRNPPFQIPALGKTSPPPHSFLFAFLYCFIYLFLIFFIIFIFLRTTVNNSSKLWDVILLFLYYLFILIDN